MACYDHAFVVWDSARLYCQKCGVIVEAGVGEVAAQRPRTRRKGAQLPPPTQAPRQLTLDEARGEAIRNAEAELAVDAIMRDAEAEGLIPPSGAPPSEDELEQGRRMSAQARRKPVEEPGDDRLQDAGL